jgi:hypothetical protein
MPKAPMEKRIRDQLPNAATEHERRYESGVSLEQAFVTLPIVFQDGL